MTSLDLSPPNCWEKEFWLTSEFTWGDQVLFCQEGIIGFLKLPFWDFYWFLSQLKRVGG